MARPHVAVHIDRLGVRAFTPLSANRTTAWSDARRGWLRSVVRQHACWSRSAIRTWPYGTVGCCCNRGRRFGTRDFRTSRWRRRPGGPEV